MSGDTACYIEKRDTATFGLTKVMARCFRNFESLELELMPAPVVLTAPNGSGKTNLLEALSLFSPGKGLRSAKFCELQKQHMASSQCPTQPWQAGISLEDNTGILDLGTALVAQSGVEKRILKCQGELLKSQASLVDYLNVVWFTPSMGSLLSESGQVQRQFIDRLTFGYDAQHAKKRSHYDKVMRERNTILRDYGTSAQGMWLDPVEENLAQLSYDIIEARHHLLYILGQTQATTELFPQFTGVMEGEAETLFNHIQGRESCVRAFCEQYRRSRSIDGIKGTTSHGPHRSKLRVTHVGKQMPAEFCSTGEQKMLVLAIILAFVKRECEKPFDDAVNGQIKKRSEGSHRGLLLLLDDVVDHLDAQHRRVLLQEVVHLSKVRKSQVWMTGSDPSAFAPLENTAQFLTQHHLNN